MSDHTDTTLTDTERETLAKAVCLWWEGENLPHNDDPVPCSYCRTEADGFKQAVESIVAARVAAARADERAKWVTRLDALATEYEERASHLRQYGVHSNRIADLREAAARKLRALIEGADQ